MQNLDASELGSAKGKLKKQVTKDRSSPLVEPASVGVMRAISSGRFELKHVEEKRDASAPALEAGTGWQEDTRPTVMAELKLVSQSSLKNVKSNDRSDPVLEKWVHIDVNAKPVRKCLVDEINQKKSTIDAMHACTENHCKENLDKITRPALMSEIKAASKTILTFNESARRKSTSEMQKNVHSGLMTELRQKSGDIAQFTTHAANNLDKDNFRSRSRPSLVSEIKQKSGAIRALSKTFD
jgi:hypothetical protein